MSKEKRLQMISEIDEKTTRGYCRKWYPLWSPETPQFDFYFRFRGVRLVAVIGFDGEILVVRYRDKFVKELLPLNFAGTATIDDIVDKEIVTTYLNVFRGVDE